MASSCKGCRTAGKLSALCAWRKASDERASQFHCHGPALGVVLCCRLGCQRLALRCSYCAAQPVSDLSRTAAVSASRAKPHQDSTRIFQCAIKFPANIASKFSVAADLGKLLLDLRSTTAGLRGDFAGLPARIERANRGSLAEYASICTAVLEAMAAGGSRLAEAGEELAQKAESHAADARMIRESWPK